MSSKMEKASKSEEAQQQLSRDFSEDGGQVTEQAGENLHRRLNNRQIQLIAIGGSIGTGLFISIGNGLHQAGPVGLLLAFVLYSAMVTMVNNGMAEMMTLYPVAGGFIRLAGQFVDDAFGFMAGWNFFVYEALLIPFEISAFAIIVNYWNENIPIWSMVLLCILLYAFRNWSNPSSFATVRTSGSLGRFEGFIAAMWNVSFSVVGPEYISLVAAEAKHPRTYMKAAYKTVYIRFMIFFFGSALAVGTVLSWNDPTLVSILRGGSSGAGTGEASPYVIAMKNMGITVFPDVVNALILTSIFFAGNTYVYCASRSLYSLAIEGRAPRFLTKVTRKGIPIYCFLVTISFSLLGFLQVSSGTAKALNTLINLVTAGAFMNYVIMSITFVFWYRATQAQNLNRRTLHYFGWLQPYCGWISSVFFILVVGFYGYTSFDPWDTETFFGCYTMPMVAIVTFTAWKVIKKTKLHDPATVDLVWVRPEIDAYETSELDTPKTFWEEMTFGLYRKKQLKDEE